MSRIKQLQKSIDKLEELTYNSIEELENTGYDLDKHDDQLLQEEKAVIDTIDYINREIRRIFK